MMRPKKQITYIIASRIPWLFFEWIIDRIDPSRFELSFILLSDGTPVMAPFLQDKGIDFLAIPYHDRE
ncbi:MAG: hypothetical protein AAFP19_25105, partial [Bacteroidota bacterium]